MSAPSCFLAKCKTPQNGGLFLEIAFLSRLQAEIQVLPVCRPPSSFQTSAFVGWHSSQCHWIGSPRKQGRCFWNFHTILSTSKIHALPVNRMPSWISDFCSRQTVLGVVPLRCRTTLLSCIRAEIYIIPIYFRLMGAIFDVQHTRTSGVFLLVSLYCLTPITSNSRWNFVAIMYITWDTRIHYFSRHLGFLTSGFTWQCYW